MSFIQLVRILVASSKIYREFDIQVVSLRSSQITSIRGIIPTNRMLSLGLQWAISQASIRYLDWVQYVLNQTNPPQTFTTSYADDEQSVPRDYAQRVCNSFAQLGARGVSLLFGSGDGGVGSGECTTNDGTNKTMFIPTFPATWYVDFSDRKVAV